MSKFEKALLFLIPIIGLSAGWFFYAAIKDGQTPAKSTAGTASSNQAKAELNITDAFLYEDSAPIIGPKDAKAKIVIFSDYQCPYCKDSSTKMTELLTKYDGKIALIHRNFVVHPTAEIHAKAAEAAYLQGKFKEMDSAIFTEAPKDEAALIVLAKKLGLDENKFSSDLKSDVVSSRISKDDEEARAIGLTGTPSVFLNGKQSSISKLDVEIAEALK